jgi:hypothetical protein
MVKADQSPTWPALPDYDVALSVGFAWGPETFPDLLKRVVEHSDDRIVGVIVIQAKAHPGPVVFIVLLDKSLVRIRGEREIVNALRRECDVHVLAARRMVVVINPARACLNIAHLLRSGLKLNDAARSSASRSTFIAAHPN